MNLINEPWLPVRQRNGEIITIAPWQITQHLGEERELMELASIRPDFDGALIQFLIGLLQTAYTPKDSRQWRQYLQQPPTPTELQQILQPFVSAFNFISEEKSFLQDDYLSADASEFSISKLLIEFPGEKTLTDNKDHFIKRDQITKLCPHCAAMALLTMQVNSPGGGAGYRTGLRGGGPLTTLILGKNLWQTIWLNVLEEDYFIQQKTVKDWQLADIFPWLGPLQTSENGEAIGPMDVHPAQCFWAMPLRIRLTWQTSTAPKNCDLCAKSGQHFCENYHTKNYGRNYKGAWLHPLSPYYLAQEGPSAVHPQPDGIAYRHWLGWVQGSTEAKKERRPAQVVQRYWQRQATQQPRLWAFGYEIYNSNKVRSWQEGILPLILIESQQQIYQDYTKLFIEVAEEVVKILRQQIRNAWFDPNQDINFESLAFINWRFWRDTESEFFQQLQRLQQLLANHSLEEALPMIQALAQAWLNKLIQHAEIIFNQLAQTDSIETANLQRIANAWNNLQRFLHGKKLRQLLGIADKVNLVNN